MDVVRWIDKRQHWWRVFVVIFAVSVVVVGYIGYKTYQYAPPIADFVTKGESGTAAVVFPARSITDGQQVFFRYGLMEYGSYLGDGAMRGPDFSAQALHLTATWMNEFYDDQWRKKVPEAKQREHVVRALVQEELKKNRYDADTNQVTMSPAQAAAFEKLVLFYGEVFGEGGTLAGAEAFEPVNYITEPKEIRDFAAFCYWGGWMCSTERPGFAYSFTHNWPY